MAMHVCTGAMMQCSFGMAPSTFVATPKMVQTSYMDAGNIMDNVPMMNIPPFGMCQSLANPQVAAATASAPPAPTVLVANQPALNNTSKLICNWAGVIQITNPGQTTEVVP
jgi:hypothetical protein